MQRQDQLWYHAVWGTKHRKPLLQVDHFKAIAVTCAEREDEWQFHLEAVNGIEDHVHVLIQIHPSQPVAKVIGWIKGASSHAFGEAFEWQSGYSIVTISPAEVPLIKEYILDQPKHHQEESLIDQLELQRH